MAQRFIRCQLCGMPHPAEAPLCPVHQKPVVPAMRPPSPDRASLPPPPLAPRGIDATQPGGGTFTEAPLALPTPEAPLLGRLLQGRYRVTGLIARGGMGVVYDAVQVNLGRRVAIKCLHPKYARDAVAIARFQKEAVVSGSFGHPHIVEVFDMGVLEDGAPFLVMERLEGETLTARMRRERRLGFKLSVSVARQTVSALVATHARGILHRDLKPDNLFLVARGDDTPRVKVLDYGVSKAMTALGDPRLTRAGFVMGTPSYMAPEQARGESDLDGRVDLYAVGVILYEMLTGRLAFVARTPAALLMEMQRATPPRPSMLRPGVSPTIDALVMRCISLSRGDRPRDAAALQRELHQLGPIEDEAPIEDDDPTEVNELPETFERADTADESVRVIARKR
ncbi:MAG: serine/threonine protein kinase [Deltaproteobacteria bacterium]|nr:serine/threonine protein kinase [Deltaproteobacteria bacterium]